MAKRNGAGLVLGLIGGALGAYWLSKAYTRAKATCPPFRRRVYTDPTQMIAAFGEFWHHPERVRALLRDLDVDRRFAQKLLITVAGVHGTRADHLRRYPALTQGLDEQQVAGLLEGNLVAQATVEEAPALFYAVEYARTLGHPEPELTAGLAERYDAPKAAALVSLVQLANMAALVGNTLDALISRILGQPALASSLGNELLVVGLFLFGIVPLGKVLVARVLWLAPES
jgi:hypothetical protein